MCRSLKLSSVNNNSHSLSGIPVSRLNLLTLLLMSFSARLIFFSPADVRIGYYHPYYAFVLLVPPTLSIKNRKIKYEGSPRIWWDMIVAEG